MDQARGYRVSGLKRALAELSRLDRDLKSSGLPAKFLMERSLRTITEAEPRRGCSSVTSYSLKQGLFPAEGKPSGGSDFRMFLVGTVPTSSSLAFRSNPSGLRISRDRWYTCSNTLAPVSVVSCCQACSRLISRSSLSSPQRLPRAAEEK